MKKGDEENRKRALKLLVITDSQVLLSVLEAVRDGLEDRTQAIRNGAPCRVSWWLRTSMPG
jgi:hypothetical protein